MLVNKLLFEETGVTRIHHFHLAHHLTYNHLKVLVVDLHALQTVHILYFVHNIFLYGCGPHDCQNVGRCGSTVGERHTCTDIVVLLYQYLLGQWNHILLGLSRFGSDGDFLVSALDLAERHLSVDFGYHSRVRWITRFEQLGYTRKTSRDVTCFAHGTRYLHQCITGLDVVVLIFYNVRTKRKGVCTQYIVVFIYDVSRGRFGFITRLDDYLLLQAGLFVRLNLVGHVLGKVLKADLSSCFRDDHSIEWVPFADEITLLHLVAIVEVKLRSVGNIVRYQYDLGVGINDAHFYQSAHNHLVGFITGVGCLHVAQLIEFQDTIVLGCDAVFGCYVRSNTSHVECTQRKLCTRFSDRLCGNYPHSFTFLYHASRGQVSSVALRAYTMMRFTGQHRTDLHTFNGGLINFSGDIFGDLFTCVHEDFSRVGVLYIVHGDTTQYAFIE